jgi:Tfp pilus assembly protein PilP
MKPLVIGALAIVALGAPGEVEGQQAQRPAPASAQASSGRQTPGWSYDPQGRRDPFISLRNRTTTASTTQNRPPGLAGVTISEIAIRGIVRSGADFLALVQAPDGRTFQLRRNAKLFDGVVKQITIDAVVFTQEVNDPLSLVKQREVRKTMKPGDREEEL